jgi:glycogen phosphorylase
MTTKKITAAYFSMEIALNSRIKSYAGGLGILAGDTLKTAADMGIEMAGVTLLYKYGYFKQILDNVTGEQGELNDTWDYESILNPLKERIHLEIEGRKTAVKIWMYEIKGAKGTVPILFLDTDLEENEKVDRYASFSLYTKYEETRIRQEIILGIGGVLALEKLNCEVKKYHLNESHAAFACLRLEEKMRTVQRVKEKVVFTTHTPVKHGHRGYEPGQYKKFLKKEHYDLLQKNTAFQTSKRVLLTDICYYYSGYTNAVSKKHAEVTRDLFPDHRTDYITNGIDIGTWTAPETAQVFDKYFDNWRESPDVLRNALRISDGDISNMHKTNKSKLLNFLQKGYNRNLNSDILTIGFARRVDAYKRPDFIFRDMERLRFIAEKFGGLQILFAGKSFPDVSEMEAVISKIFQFSKNGENDKLKIVYLQDYDMEIAKLLVSGCDIWLNNPIKPLEASGTSGMKAALNGVPNFSTLDGWWLEGWIEGQNGWAIGSLESNNEVQELEDLYVKLEKLILPIYHFDSKKWLKLRKNAISLNGSYFNTHRMINEYLLKAYLA